MRITTIIVVTLVCLLMLLATDARAEDKIYRWVDENGVVHFGDQPGGQAGAEVIEIQKSEGVSDQSPTPQSSEESNQQADPEPSYAQQLRDERAKKRKDAAEEAKITAQACSQRRTLISQLEPSTRVIVEYEDGTIGRLDDNERLKTLNEAKAYIAENCDN